MYRACIAVCCGWIHPGYIHDTCIEGKQTLHRGKTAPHPHSLGEEACRNKTRNRVSPSKRQGASSLGTRGAEFGRRRVGVGLLTTRLALVRQLRKTRHLSSRRWHVRTSRIDSARRRSAATRASLNDMRYLLFSLAGLLAIAAALPAETPTGLPTETPVQQSVEYRQLQAVAAAPPPPKKSGFSIWSAAKNFFISREKVKAKVSGSPPPTSSLPMPAKYGVSYKGMIAWFCAKPENKVKALCKLQEQGKASDSQVRSDLVKVRKQRAGVP